MILCPAYFTSFVSSICLFLKLGWWKSILLPCLAIKTILFASHWYGILWKSTLLKLLFVIAISFKLHAGNIFRGTGVSWKLLFIEISFCLCCISEWFVSGIGFPWNCFSLKRYFAYVAFRKWFFWSWFNENLFLVKAISFNVHFGGTSLGCIFQNAFIENL